MQLVVASLSHAFRDLFKFKVLWIVIWPALSAAAFWMGTGFVFWDTISVWIEHALDYAGVYDWLGNLHPRWIANGIQAILHIILFVPLIFLTALLITAFFAMPALVDIVARQDYRQLERERGGNMLANLINATMAMMVFIGIWLTTVPLWLFGVGMLVPFLAATYLNQRLFRFDALAEHASRDEMNTLFRSDRASWWGLGLVTGLLQFVPILNFIAPVVTALAFIHFGLARLTELRRPYQITSV